MKRLCVVVIAISFIGAGPLMSLFHSVLKSNADSSAVQYLTEKMKSTTGLLPSQKKIESETFLITQGKFGQNSSQLDRALFLKVDPENHKLMGAAVSLPHYNSSGKNEFKTLKNELKTDYNLGIDHCLQVDASGMAHIIDLLDPQGILLSAVSDVHEKTVPSRRMHGDEIVKMMNNEPGELKAIFFALKTNVAETQSPEKLLRVAPFLIQETMKSVKTDLGKGQLMALGLSAIMDPITGVETIQIEKGKPKTGESMKQAAGNQLTFVQ